MSYKPEKISMSIGGQRVEGFSDNQKNELSGKNTVKMQITLSIPTCEILRLAEAIKVERSCLKKELIVSGKGSNFDGLTLKQLIRLMNMHKEDQASCIEQANEHSKIVDLIKIEIDAKLNGWDGVDDAMLFQDSPVARTIDAIIANIKECDEKINHHKAELATYTEGREKFVSEINERLSQVGAKVVDCGTEEGQSVITDWRDLRVGDVIWFGGGDGHASGEYPVVGLEDEGYRGSHAIEIQPIWVNVDDHEWKFIRRP